MLAPLPLESEQSSSVCKASWQTCSAWPESTQARALLATLGVIFGSFVLLASLSVGQGVQETIVRESHRSDYLRRIDVRPQWGGREVDIPEEELQVKGQMSDAKREREDARGGLDPRQPEDRRPDRRQGPLSRRQCPRLR